MIVFLSQWKSFLFGALPVRLKISELVKRTQKQRVEVRLMLAENKIGHTKQKSTSIL
jgi:hypothetical protein